MNHRPDWPDATVLHAELAPELLAERRALYQLAVELFWRDAPRLPATRLDNPLFRFRVGEALADRVPFDPAATDDLDDVVTEVGGQLKMAAGAGANDRLAAALRIIHGQSGAPGKPPRLLTEAGGESFREAIEIIEAGLARLREVSPALARDLLPHTALLVVLDPATSNGLVSASSRLFPGLILIDKPSCPYDVADALVHEGAHQKFFDLAITRDFLGAETDDRTFSPSWSGARWPLEQVVAAFHAYALMAQFAEAVTTSGETGQLGPNSLLPFARTREIEIGQWLLGVEELLESDAQWLLRALLREDSAAIRTIDSANSVPDGQYALKPFVRMARMATGRMLLAGPGHPPRLVWLNRNAAEVVDQLGQEPLALSALGPEKVEILSGLVASELAYRVK
ncbi:aKG-HExxH-type peptide beta-hydroxylase [Amycolatopsis pithecellobii]|uniref:HEXXH motif domain-containing protein n=1 Tax=Amycolatopsis pithecellobii TaxID=664692 RepID=A0A6N7Z8G9_9PSEU|nr:HEXXH motif-containing putative peptide modification protein [Amycolatopsis pithecellobii]MTD57830.1 HEXXH motif domain-containing protein [Amycolatopsis pithecellobii]